MNVYRSIAEVGSDLAGASLCLGNFDGVHLGHQALFATAKIHAARRGTRAAALTFSPHPAKVLAPELAPRQLSPLPQKLALMEKVGLDAVVVQPFDRAYAALGPADFERSLLDQLKIGELVVGFDYTYGKARAGTVDTLRAACAARGAAFSVVPKVTVDGLPASSTKVRELLLDGKVEAASMLLDRHYALEGEVVHGAGRGRGIGFPTANLETDFELLPGSGVYAVLARINDAVWPSAANIGRKPTVAGADAPVTVELHLIGFDGDLYGQRLEAVFLQRLRSEQRFSGLPELKAQIARDVDRARAVCAQARALPLDAPFERGASGAR